MLDLALHGGEGPMTLADISSRQRISLSYLEQLFSKLRKNGLVLSTRGPGGGYSLSKPVGEIAIASIIEAVDEKVDATRCGGLANCHDQQRCLTHDLWMSLSEQIHGFLAGISLGDLIEKQAVKEVMERQENDCLEALRGSNQQRVEIVS